MSTPQPSALPPRRFRATPPFNKRRKLHPVWKAILIVGFTLCFAALSYGVYLYNQADQMLDDISVGTEKDIPPEEMAKTKSKTILVLGLDARAGLGTMNTDVIMVVSLNPGNKGATIVSIPRDTYIKPSDYVNGYKANRFYSIEYLEDKETAFQDIKGVFGEYLDIPIDYVFVVNFKTFEDMIDELDGIMIDVDMDMRYVDNADGTNINLNKGYQKLDGKNSLDFVRYRQSNDGSNLSSDFERNERQHQVISAIVDRLKSFDVVFKLTGIFNAMGENIETDIPKEQIKSFIVTYAGIQNDNIEYIPIQGTWRSPYVYLDEEELDLAKLKLKERLD